MARSDFTFFYPKRVRFAEIDAQAVLFNSRYLEYFDIGIVEYWRAVGMYGEMGLTGGMEFHVAKASVEYKAAILLDEKIDICVRTARIGSSSMTVVLELHGAGANAGGPNAGRPTAAGCDDLRAVGEEVQVHVAEVRGRPTPIPQHVVDMFEKFEGRPLRHGAPA